MKNLIENFINENIDGRINTRNITQDDLSQICSKLDDYLFRVFACSYINKAITLGAIKYKKTIQNKKNKEELSLNVISDGFEEERLNLVADERPSYREILRKDNYSNEIFYIIFKNPELVNGINILTDWQKKIIYLLYIVELEEATIADEFNVSVQAINKSKNLALRKLRRSLKEKTGNERYVF